MAPQSVRLFGMHIRSDIPLPGLEPEPAATDPDVVIKFGPVPKPVGPVTELVVDESGAILNIPGVARYGISNGSRIVVQPEAGVPEANIRLFLLGSTMGVLLHQRGLLPLHASAVEIDGRAAAFLGRSGAGKSTLAAAFHDSGYRVIADDICVIRFDEHGKASACPGMPRLRLWEEALSATGRTAKDYELSYAGDESFRKFDVPVLPDVNQRDDTPLAAVMHLQAGDSLQFRLLNGSGATDVVFANTYRGGYIRSVGHPSRHWQAVIALIRAAPIFELSRPLGLGRLETNVRQIAEFIRQTDAKAG